MYIEYILELLYPFFIDFLNPIHPLTLVNKDLYNLFNKKGYLKEITYDHKNSHKNFISLFLKHKDYIRTVRMMGITNPFIWTPVMSTQCMLYNCYLAHSFARYDRLKLLYLDRCCLGINLNWGNLRNLEVLFFMVLIIISKLTDSWSGCQQS